ncbi:MAG: hypothetical protein ACRDYF_15235 [Acidimicrobiia bacterium]
MTDWWAERQRRAEEVWRQAEGLGAFLEVGQNIQVGDEVVEVVATLADVTQTVVVYRAPAGSDLFPSPLFAEGGASGGVMGDLLVAHLPPAEGLTVLVDFGRFDRGSHEVELPIDRARTRPYERRSTSLPAPLMSDGARVAIRGAAVGLLEGTIDLEITSDDPALVAATLGSRSLLPHPHRRAGSGPLWRDWFPPPEPTPTPTQPSDDDDETGDPEPSGSSRPLRRRLGASATATARFTPLPEGQQSAPTPAPPTPGHLLALPSRQVLAIHGWSSGGGPIPETLSLDAILRFDPPPSDASAVELVLDKLIIFRHCDAQLVEVPGPRPGEPVDLGGRSLICGSDRIELVRWEPSEHGRSRLVVRPSRPELWPDVRVVAGSTSASLWLRPTAEGELAGGLPGMYDPLFPAREPVTLGLRMLGRKANIPPVTVPFAPAHTP